MSDSALSLQMPPSVPMTDEQFFDFCQVNRELRIERDRHGVISIQTRNISQRRRR